MAARKNNGEKKRPDAKALRSLNEQELGAMLLEQQQQLMSARFQHATAQLENTAELKTLRRQVARIETILNEKQRA